ncbi:MAG: S-layer homology domain-containing protein [Acidimicrobiaceae bacterium]|nr:S-layer homology domain-containing protein [Acidimicrobiaceae bacterium]MYE74943.1 S-layer homology domain-containing protein [Acidimicrobiaceae bacterium]MYH43577.1 S-layer homology domain-containing protein [Acidimicrobiaceae bacterium]MYJ42424.1 S-layer homology domain-containing protein [Acidimicrobiaceae bacterium]MYJ80436.1 S-layer homology domain-containing protein [Acidimicrobiaceae bacterium]
MSEPGAGVEDVFGDFDEVASVHEPGVRALFEQGVLDGVGCGAGLLCPAASVTRWEFAVMVVRVLDGGDPGPLTRSRFADTDRDLWWARHVERLAELGATVGCRIGPLRYCPDDPLTRAQTASMLVRAFDLDRAFDPAGFTDTAGSVHADDIDALYAAGITNGCRSEPLRYCPQQSTTRAEAATLLHRRIISAGSRP